MKYIPMYNDQPLTLDGEIAAWCRAVDYDLTMYPRHPDQSLPIWIAREQLMKTIVEIP